MRRVSLSNQAGSVAVTVAIMLPALLGMGVVVIDIANQWVHKRHLQAQADGAAFAGAQLLRTPCDSGVNADVLNEASKYAGASAALSATGSLVPTTFTSQLDVHGGESVVGLLNSPTYPEQSIGNSSEQNTPGQPCTDNAVDVKLTDKGVPFFMAGAIPFLSSALSSFGRINVHARATLKQAQTATGVLPYAVTDPAPQAVRVSLVDDSGTAISGGANIALTQPDPVNDPYTWTGGASITPPAGDDTASPVTGASKGDYTQPPINVQVAASGASGTITPDCHLGAEECYPTGTPAKGLVQLRAWPQHAPTSNDVAVISGFQLTPNPGAGCASDGYFSRVTATNCTVTAVAAADFQTGSNAPQYPAVGTSSNNDDAVMCMATGVGGYPGVPQNGGGVCGKNTIQMIYQGVDSATGHHLWMASFAIPNEATTTGPTFVSAWAVAQKGAVSISGNAASCNSGNRNPCVMSPPIPAQSFFSGAQAYSGYLDQLTVSSTLPTAYSRSQCNSGCSPLSLGFTVHFQPLRPAQSVNDPVFELHLGKAQNNQDLDCGSGNTMTQIAQGCTFKFRLWNKSADPSCSTFASYAAQTSPPVSAPPYPCVNAQPGKAVGQVAAGMQARVLNGASNCNNDQYRNHWSQYPWTTDPTLPLRDHRLMPVFLTSFGAFTNAPTGTNVFVPVTHFALFYITGWSGSQPTTGDPCQSGTNLPAGETVDDTPSAGDTVVGHFVNLVDSMLTPDPGTADCHLDQLDPCIPVLTD